MGISQFASGTWTSATGPVTLSTITGPRVAVVQLDLTDVDHGDKLDFWFSGSVLNGGTQRRISHATRRFNHEQLEPMKVSVPVVCYEDTLFRAASSAGTGDSIPWTVITTQDGGMTTPSSGTLAAIDHTVGTDEDLATETTAGIYLFEIDTNALQVGDELEVIIESRISSGGSDLIHFQKSFAPTKNGPSRPIKHSLPFVSQHTTTFRINQRAGTERAFPWAVRLLALEA